MGNCTDRGHQEEGGCAGGLWKGVLGVPRPACHLGCHPNGHFKVSWTEEQVSVLPDHLPSLFMGQCICFCKSFLLLALLLLLQGLLFRRSSGCCQLSAHRQCFQRVLTFVCFGVCVPGMREVSSFLICLKASASGFLKKWK